MKESIKQSASIQPLLFMTRRLITRTSTCGTFIRNIDDVIGATAFSIGGISNNVPGGVTSSRSSAKNKTSVLHCDFSLSPEMHLGQLHSMIRSFLGSLCCSFGRRETLFATKAKPLKRERVAEAGPEPSIRCSSSPGGNVQKSIFPQAFTKT